MQLSGTLSFISSAGKCAIKNTHTQVLQQRKSIFNCVHLFKTFSKKFSSFLEFSEGLYCRESHSTSKGQGGFLGALVKACLHERSREAKSAGEKNNSEVRTRKGQEQMDR